MLQHRIENIHDCDGGQIATCECGWTGKLKHHREHRETETETKPPTNPVQQNVRPEDRARRLIALVASQNKDGKKYKLFSPWGHDLQLSEVITDCEFLATKPIKKFKTDVTHENLDKIEAEVRTYFGLA